MKLISKLTAPKRSGGTKRPTNFIGGSVIV